MRMHPSTGIPSIGTLRKPKSREILIFVCLQKDAKQCCDATQLERTHCAGHLLPNEYNQAYGIMALFGIFLETNKYQNLTRPGFSL